MNGNQENKSIDEETGEIKIYKKGQNFLKMYKPQMIKMFEVIGGGKAKVVAFLLKNVHVSNNTVVKTQKEIAEGCNVSLKTVSTVLNELESKQLIKKKVGSIMISPTIFFRGDERQKYRLMMMFKDF